MRQKTSSFTPGFCLRLFYIFRLVLSYNIDMKILLFGLLILTAVYLYAAASLKIGHRKFL